MIRTPYGLGDLIVCAALLLAIVCICSGLAPHFKGLFG